MTLLLDASGLVAQADVAAPEHSKVVQLLRAERGSLVLSAFTAAEADYMIASRFGLDAELAFVRDLASETYETECLSKDELGELEGLLRRYRDLELGISDASVVVLAARFRTTRILTLAERDFRAMTPLQGGHFTVLPADA